MCVYDYECAYIRVMCADFKALLYMIVNMIMHEVEMWELTVNIGVMVWKFTNGLLELR